MLHRTSPPRPPQDPGHWTLLQQRMDRSLWQWDRELPAGNRGITRFVITHDPSRLDFETYDEADTMFRMLDD